MPCTCGQDTGQEELDTVNLVDYNARFYDPALGRFLSVDPVVGHPETTQGINPYSYVENNPLNATDPTGECMPGHPGPQNGPCLGLSMSWLNASVGIATHISGPGNPNAIQQSMFAAQRAASAVQQLVHTLRKGHAKQHRQGTTGQDQRKTADHMQINNDLPPSADGYHPDMYLGGKQAWTPVNRALNALVSKILLSSADAKKVFLFLAHGNSDLITKIRSSTMSPEDQAQAQRFLAAIEIANRATNAGALLLASGDPGGGYAMLGKIGQLITAIEVTVKGAQILIRDSGNNISTKLEYGNYGVKQVMRLRGREALEARFRQGLGWPNPALTTPNK